MTALLQATWLAHYVARLRARPTSQATLWETIEAYTRANPPSPPFRCVCGAVLHNPADPDVMRIHALHVQAASELRRLPGRDFPRARKTGA